MRTKYLLVTALVIFVTEMPATAQTTPPGNPWSHGTTIDVFVGAASASSRVGPLAGGSVGWELTPRVGLEGRMAWWDRPGLEQAFAAALTARANLMSRHAVVPFLRAGFGLYRASVDVGDMGMPGFYRRRLGPHDGVRQTFTDPAVVVGGGAHVFAKGHWAIRPEIQGILASRGSRGYFVTAVTVGVAYTFESRPITPSRVKIGDR